MERPFNYQTFIVAAAVTFIAVYGLITKRTSFLEPPPPPVSSSVVILPVATTTPVERQEIIAVEPPVSEYIEIVEGCGPYFEGTCVNMRSGPGKEYPVIKKLRNGIVLKVTGVVTQNEETWYKVSFDGGIRYPERVTEDWYVAADYVNLIQDEGVRETTAGMNASSTKRIIVKRSTEMLYAYDGGTLFMEQPISVGLELTPTPRGAFAVYKKMPSSYMQGPIPGISDQYYDLPGVPWDLYFTYEGGAIHGAYWHDKFGQPWSHGCVNLPPDQAHLLYLWADLGTPVIVQD